MAFSGLSCGDFMRQKWRLYESNDTRVSPYGLVDTNDQDQVVGFREKVEVPYWINAGIYIFDRRIEEELPQLGDHEDRTFPRLAREGKMAALKSRAFWRGVDSFKDLQEAEEYLSLR